MLHFLKRRRLNLSLGNGKCLPPSCQNILSVEGEDVQAGEMGLPRKASTQSLTITAMAYCNFVPSFKFRREVLITACSVRVMLLQKRACVIIRLGQVTTLVGISGRRAPSVSSFAPTRAYSKMCHSPLSLQPTDADDIAKLQHRTTRSQPHQR